MEWQVVKIKAPYHSDKLLGKIRLVHEKCSKYSRIHMGALVGMCKHCQAKPPNYILFQLKLLLPHNFHER